MCDKEHAFHLRSANLHFGRLYVNSSSGCLVARRNSILVWRFSERLSRRQIHFFPTFVGCQENIEC